MSQSPPTLSTRLELEKQTRIVHTVALGAVVACPILALIPPRRLNFYTLLLVGTTAYSANVLLKQSTGRSVWEHLGGVRKPEMPTSAVETPSVVGMIQQQTRGEVAARDAWKARREQEIRQDVEEGKGFGDMISDQIREVWNQGKPKETEDEG